MKRAVPGSALLIVIMITTALVLYASTMFWVDALLNQSVHDLIKIHKHTLLADALARYALALYAKEKGIHEHYEINPWPPHLSGSYYGTIDYTKEPDGMRVITRLFNQGALVQSIQYVLCQDNNLLRVSQWQRTST